SFLSIDDHVLGSRSPSDFVEQDLRSLTLPASLLLASSPETFGKFCNGDGQVAEAICIFISKFEVSFINVYRANSLNECRIRRTLCHALLEWDNLQVEAEEIDALAQRQLHQDTSIGPPNEPYSLSSWVYHHKLEMVRTVIQLGFEQAIYAPYELAGMYWYLVHICDIHLAHLERISYYVTETQAGCKRDIHNDGREQALQECETALNRLFKHYSWLEATRALASSLHLIYVVVCRHGHCKQPSKVYSTDEMRHEIRMKPFLNVTVPVAVSAQDLADHSLLVKSSTEELLGRLTTSISKSCQSWQRISKTSWNVGHVGYGTEKQILDAKWQNDIRNSLRTAIMADMVAVKLKQLDVRTGISRFELPELSSKDRPHARWIVPVVEIGQKENGGTRG
ncbi:N-alpha-acetyltransferase, non-catalitic subunit, partial [Elasticomyces elasticus]